MNIALYNSGQLVLCNSIMFSAAVYGQIHYGLEVSCVGINHKA